MSIQKSDIIFTAPQSLIFKLIRWWTKDIYGHVGIVVDVLKDHVLIVEATARGIDVNSLIWRKDEPYGVYRIKFMTEKQKQSLIDEAYTHVGKSYDFMSFGNFVCGRPIFGSEEKLFCSELVYRTLVALRILEPTLAHPEKVSPKDLRVLLEETGVAEKVEKKL